MQPRGRGRAALFAQATSTAEERVEPVPVGRGRSAPSGGSSEENRPRGRGAIFRQAASEVSSSSGSGGCGDADTRTNVSGNTFETGTALTGSSGSGGDEPRRGRGRAALFSQSTPSSSDVVSDVRDLSIQEKPKEAFTGPSPEKKEPVMMHGRQGKPVEASANYIRLEYMNMDRQILEYEATFNPPVDSVRERSFVVNQHFKNFGGRVKVFDSGWRIFTPDRLNNDVNTASVTLRTGLTVEMTIKFKRAKKLSECRYILNLIFKRIMNELQLVKFGRSDYNPKEAQRIDEYKLEIWPGCITAIDEYEGGIMLCCDASHRVLRSQTCLDMIRAMEETLTLPFMQREDFFHGVIKLVFSRVMKETVTVHYGCVRVSSMARRIRNNNKKCDKCTDIARARGSQTVNYKDDILDAFMGVSVIANYNQKIYKVDDIDFSENPRGTFLKGDKKISYIEYYKTQYNIDIHDLSQPMIVHRARRKEKGKEKVDELIYLVPELCSPTGLTDKMRADFKLMRAVADFTRVSPAARQIALAKFIRGIKNNEKAHQLLKDWNLKLPDTTIDLTARIMEPERIFFGGNKSVTEVSADWGRAASNNKMLSTIDLHRWAVLYFNKNQRNVGEFVECFMDVSRRVGLEVTKPLPVPLQNDNTRFYCEEIRKLAPRNPQILVIVFPSNRDDRYAAVKKLCNSELGLASQVINLRTISNPKNLKSVVTKVILQMNCKVGGALWGITIPYKEEGIMFCGIDAYHDASKKSHSVVALVTSTNHTCTRWASGTSLHNRGQEISDVITGLLKDCLQLWHKANQTFPSRVVMYRDGVGDGQLGVVRDFEVPQFYKLFSQIRSDYRPKLTYVVVQKRINTRIYTKERNQFTNPPPGTIMDHTITRRDWFDYFLVSQNVRQGTVSPTHYVVIHDESDMTVDTIQKLSYKMTHLYYNWNGTVRVPAPCQYAHKLAYLVGQHMHSPATENLRNVLFFL